MPPLPAPNPAGTRPIQPDDVQRIVAHIAFTRGTRRHAFVFRPNFAFTLPHWALWAAHFPFIHDIHHRLFLLPQLRARRDERTQDISRDDGSTDVGIEDRAEGLTALPRCPLLLNQKGKEKELAMRPALPWHIPLHGLCAQTHTIHRIQVGPNALPNQLFPQLWRKPTPAIARDPSTMQRPLIRIFHTIQGFVQCHNWIFEVLFTKY